MTTNTTETGTGATLAAFEKRIRAEIKEAEARIEKFEAKTKERRLEAETTAVNTLKSARQNLEQKLKELATTQEARVARAKTDIDAAAVGLKTALDDLGRRLSTLSERK